MKNFLLNLFFLKNKPRTARECPECGYMEAVFFEQQSRRSGRTDTRMVLYYACANTECGFRWTDNLDNKPKQAAPQDEDNNIPEGYIEDDNYMNDIYSSAQGLDNAYQGNKSLVFIYIYILRLKKILSFTNRSFVFK
jgi:hypothetical protein